MDQLKIEPEKQGKALVDSLAGLRSVRAVGQRYRIIYKVEPEKVSVIVVGVGRRKDGDKKDIYTLLEKFIDEVQSLQPIPKVGRAVAYYKISELEIPNPICQS